MSEKEFPGQDEIRTKAIQEHGHLWRQAIEHCGVSDPSVKDKLLQVCAACYLDGAIRGFALDSLDKQKS